MATTNVPTPEVAREALDGVEEARRTAEGLSVDPRWFAAAQSILIGVAMGLVSGGLVARAPVERIVVAIAAITLAGAGVWLQFWWRRKSGVIPKFGWSDASIAIATPAIAMVAGMQLARDGVSWGPWAAGAAFGVLRYARYELGRRNSLRTSAADVEESKA